MDKKRKFRVVLPEENAVWVVLFTPFIIGVLSTWRFAVADFAMAGLLFFVCLLRKPLALMMRSGFKNFTTPLRTTLIVGVTHGLFLLLILLLKYHLSLLLPIGLVALLSFYIEVMTKPGDTRNTLTIVTLTLSAPAAYYASSGILAPVSVALWMLCAIYFSFTMVYARGALRNPVRVKYSLRWLLTHAAVLTTAVTLLFSLLRI